MDKMKNQVMFNSDWMRPDEINFILLETASNKISSPPLKNNFNKDPRGTLLLLSWVILEGGKEA